MIVIDAFSRYDPPVKRPIGKIRRFSRLANINSLSAKNAQSAAEGILNQPLSHRRAGGAHQILHSLYRVLPGGGLAGEHQAGCAVQYGVVDVVHKAPQPPFFC